MTGGAMTGRTGDVAPSGYVLSDLRYSGAYGRLVFRSLLFGFKPYLSALALLLVFGAAGRLCFLATAWIAGLWVDQVTGHSFGVAGWPHSWLGSVPLSAPGHYLLAMGLCSAMGFALTVGFRVPVTRIGALSASRLYDAVTQHTSRLPQSFFDRTPVGRIVSRFSSDYGAVLRMAGGPLGEFIALIIDLILVSLALGLVNFHLAGVVVVNVLVNGFVYRSQRQPLRDSRREVSLTRGPCVAHFAETSQGFASVRLYDKVGSFRDRFLDLTDRHLATRLKSVWVVQRFAFSLTAATSSLLILTGALGLYLSSTGMMGIGQIAVAFTYVTMLSLTTQQFFDYLGRFDEALTGVERLGEYLALRTEPGASEAVDAKVSPRAVVISGRVPDRGSAADTSLVQASTVRDSAVRISQLRFRYGPNLPLVLGADGGLNLTVASGKSLGVVGRTGSGKSSIISALFYLYPFDNGLVTVCNRAPQYVVDSPVGQGMLENIAGVVPCPLGDYRTQMSLIAQEPVLFRGALSDNLYAAGRDSDEEAMEAALIAVGLGDWFVGLDRMGTRADRLAYAVAEGGRNLSAGQRQLICMARALLEDAPVLVMDEATSAVDPRSEEQLMRAATGVLKGKTQIRVAHRLSTLDDCDRILWLEDGRVRMFDHADVVLRALGRRGSERV